MAFEPPSNVLKAGQRPAKVRTGARTATKTQERETLEKFEELAEHPEVLVPEWLGSGSSPFAKLSRKLAKIQTMRGRPRRLKWAARGKKLWNAYAAVLLVLEGEKIPSFAPFKFQGREVKYVYRTGTGRNVLIGVQHHDDPEVRLVGYITDAHRKKLYMLSREGRLAAQGRRGSAPFEFLEALFAKKDVSVRIDERTAKCPHAQDPEWRFHYRVPDLDWNAELCLVCVKKIGGTFRDFLERRVLGPDSKVKVERTTRGVLFTIRPEASLGLYKPLAEQAFRAAVSYAEDNYVSYSDVELADWTKERLLRFLDDRPEGYVLVANELWLNDFETAADTYVESDLERRALRTAFTLRPPHLRTSDRSLHKILEPYWKEAGSKILNELSGGLLKPQELAQLERLNPSEALTSLARILGARSRFREFLQFDNLHPSLDYIVTCLQIQRAGEHRVLAEKLHSGAQDPSLRIVTLGLARALGEATNLEWQYAPHDKEAASFLEPYVRDVVNASPPKFREALTKLATALNVPAPTTPAAAA